MFRRTGSVSRIARSPPTKAARRLSRRLRRWRVSITETVETLHAINGAATDLSEALTRFETIDTMPQGDTGTADATPSDDESPTQSDSQGALTEMTSE